MSVQGYGLETDPDDDADINEEVSDWMGEFQVMTDVVVTFCVQLYEHGNFHSARTLVAFKHTWNSFFKMFPELFLLLYCAIGMHHVTLAYI